MDLIYFSEKTLPKQPGNNSKHPRVTFAKSGIIYFNGHACSLMELKPGDKVTLAQDERAPENWYFFIDDHGFEVRKGYNKNGCLFNHAGLSKKFLEAIEKNVKGTHNFRMASQPTEINGSKIKYWGLLIGS